MSELLPPHVFSCPTATGAMYHHGATVIDWVPTGHDPVIWLSEKTRRDSESGIRGGIPICWPWFGAGRSGDRNPLHGFARLTEWRLVKSTSSDSEVRATWLLHGTPTAALDYSYRLAYEVSFGARLDATLTVRNTGSTRFTFEEALHTYLRVGDARQIVIAGLDGATYLDHAHGAEPGPHTQSGDVTIQAETDRIYRTSDAIRVHDPAMSRVLTITPSQAANAVVWNPWVEKSAALPDFDDDEWQTMVCVETANVGENAIALAGGKEHTIGLSLEVART